MLAGSLLCVVGSIAVWSLLARRFEAWRVSPALALAAAGVVLGLLVRPEIVAVLDYHETEQVVELILATLLFSDAIAVRGRMLGTSPVLSSRLLFLALPLALALATVTGFLVLPDHSVPLALVIACVIMPTDVSPAPGILVDGRMPLRVRSSINVESGLNDGIVAPVFTFALAVLTATAASSGSSALGTAVEASLVALAVGLGAGAAYGLLVRFVLARSQSDDAALRIGMLAVPLATYSLAVLLHGNGFVAAFVAGVAVHLCLREDTERFTALTKDVVEATSLALWFVFGVIAGVVVVIGVTWQAVVLSVAAITLLRVVPVLLSLAGSSTTWPERLALSLLGPRGITSLVFGLLAVNAVDGDGLYIVLQAMVITVSLSLLLHGFGASAVTGRIFRGRPHQATTAPSPTGAP